jgi:GntR family transcriptional repressor for pyruvate dehydrogenase complex
MSSEERPAAEGTSLSQTDVVVQGIKAMITSGKLSAGARLPIEKELAASLAVSRGSLREGVRALAIMGVLETRQGDGTYVTSLSADRLLAPMEFMIDLQDAAGVAHVQNVRRVLESEAAALAAARIGVSELNQAGAILEGAERLISAGGDPDHEAILEADLDFHRVIAKASGNPALEALIEAMASRTVRGRLWRAIAEQGAEQRTHAEHQAILAALRAGSTEGARIRMANHLLGVQDFLEAQTPADADIPATSDGSSSASADTGAAAAAAPAQYLPPGKP